MKIKQCTELFIVFDNGNTITFHHEPDCCESNYADFKQLDDLAKETEFDEDLKFESVPLSGFRFGNEGKMFFVPCYSWQNGYYSSDIDILYNGKRVLNLFCKMVGDCEDDD